MYKYLPITDNLQEIMIMLKSLPAHSLVFDKDCNLVEINESALKLLRLRNVQEFNDRKDDMFPTPSYVKSFILELKRGVTIRHVRTLLCHTDKNQVVVELCACMINGQHDLFLFQLFEIAPSIIWNLGTITSFSDKIDKPVDDSLKIVSGVGRSTKKLFSHKKNEKIIHDNANIET